MTISCIDFYSHIYYLKKFLSLYSIISHYYCKKIEVSNYQISLRNTKKSPKAFSVY
ncbi:hypothetical protein LEQ41_00935 [Streptococcus agalactiae]|nr:hypothetical protein [Streptococcus agalactiae]